MTFAAASSSKVHTNAARTSPSSRDAACSLITVGCNGMRPSGAYSVWPRSRASESIAPPGATKAGTSAIA